MLSYKPNVNWTFFTDYILRLKEVERDVTINFLWAWWDARNKANSEAKIPLIDEVLHRTREAALFPNHDQCKKPGFLSEPRCRQSGWRPPPDGMLKINAGGSFREMEKDGAWGFVIRDCEGQGAAMSRGISRVIVETDSTNLAAALQSKSFDQAPGGVIFQEARELLNSHFVLHGVASISRSCNRCAHDLASFGITRDPDSPCIWDDPLPSFVNTLVSRDLTDSRFDE
ncbi:hypothetical protein HU200_062727 [Digitaria exilis]|uniref:RNase H type-1 domain-containing protein n=1 Tax=Digitaria exilis TaxID=1010633 RepID=A0A835A551_9POAL|nr:hypothetical protein HU200_062727 [Digitaria exilis]